MLRYCIASARCDDWISSAPSKSAIVRATRRMRSWERAVSPIVRKAFSMRTSAAEFNAQYAASFDGGIRAFDAISAPSKRLSWRSRAASTRFLTLAESSAASRRRSACDRLQDKLCRDLHAHP